jgi:hypothetical protein
MNGDGECGMLTCRIEVVQRCSLHVCSDCVGGEWPEPTFG